MNLRIRNALMFSLVCLAGLATTGCNTIRGAGEDIEKAGEEVQEAADDAKN
jgi:predicted small secreted protein